MVWTALTGRSESKFVAGVSTRGHLAPAPGHLDRRRRGRLGQLAREQVVAQIAGRHIDHGALLTQRLDVLEQDRLRHRRPARLSIAIAITITITIAGPAATAATA